MPGGGNDKFQEEVPLFQELEVLQLVRDESSQHQDGHSALFHLVRHAGYQFREPRRDLPVDRASLPGVSSGSRLLFSPVLLT